MGLEKDLKQHVPEGATPIEDISGLKLPHDISRQELFDAEFDACTDATEAYLTGSKKVKEFTREVFFKIHEVMFGNIWEWGGKKRQTEKQIGVPHYIIEEQLKVLLDDLSHWKTEKMEPIEIAVRLHHRLVLIHPFENGNGRWARLVANIYLYKNLKKIFRWPEAEMGKQSDFRNRYLEALRKADGLDYGPLLELHLGIVVLF